MNLGRYYALRITPETPHESVTQYLDSIFNCYVEDNGEIREEILAVVDEFQADGCKGRIYFDYDSGVINIKEDIRE